LVGDLPIWFRRLTQVLTNQALMSRVAAISRIGGASGCPVVNRQTENLSVDGGLEPSFSWESSSLNPLRCRLQNDATVENNNLIVSGTQDEICNSAKLGTLKGWCHIHDTLVVPKGMQSKIAVSAGCGNACAGNGCRSGVPPTLIHVLVLRFSTGMQVDSWQAT
jgi:hypothetical protein